MRKAVKKNLKGLVKTKRKLICVYDIFNRDIQSAIDQLKALQKEIDEEGWVENRFDFYAYEGYECDLIGFRPETEKERQRRLKREKTAREKAKKIKEAKIEKEKQEYLRLKKKYEDQEG